MTTAPDRRADGAWERHRLGHYELSTTEEFGPRITGLWAEDSPNLFAVLGDEVRIENASVGDYLFRGGHRLWVAPETPEITYAPDDSLCRVTQTPEQIQVSGLSDKAGFAKTLDIKSDEHNLIVEHSLVSRRANPKTVSPWGITQLPTGGVAILPLDPTETGNERLQADRSLVLWPYTRLGDPRIVWRDCAVLIHAQPGPQLKLGAGPEPRKLGYLRDGYLFSKWCEADSAVQYPDRGATAQIFLNDDFCELETLGPLKTLDRDASISHVEIWEVIRCETIDAALDFLLRRESR